MFVSVLLIFLYFFFLYTDFLFLFNFSGHSCILCPFVLVLFSYFNYYKVTNQLNASFMKFSVQFIVTLLYNVSNAWRIFRNIRLGWRLKVLQFMMLWCNWRMRWVCGFWLLIWHACSGCVISLITCTYLSIFDNGCHQCVLTRINKQGVVVLNAYVNIWFKSGIVAALYWLQRFIY